MSDWPAERTAVRRGVIHMDRIEIPRESREEDDLRLGQRPAWTLPLVADVQLVE